MPIYRYRCPRCSRIADEFRKIANRDAAPECCSGASMQRVLVAAMVLTDIEPYRSIATDQETGKRPYIQSRKQHREFLARNDLIEIGNEPFRPTQQQGGSSDISYDLDLGDL